MSKWIRGFSPNKKGSYLVFVLINSKPLSEIWADLKIGYYCECERLNYDPDTDNWTNVFGDLFHKGLIISSGGKHQYDIIWWDEFGIAETKTTIRLNFKNGKETEH